VRERGIASAQEVTGIRRVTCQPPVRVEWFHANPDNELSGPPETARRKRRGIYPKRLTEFFGRGKKQEKFLNRINKIKRIGRALKKRRLTLQVSR